MTVGLNGLKVADVTPYGVPLPNSVEITATYPSADEADFDGTPGVAGATQWKEPVRAATTASITIATALNAGDSLDGVTLAAGDRVLVKDQGMAKENGIYVVDATPYRAGDMDDDTEVLGAVVYVIAGTANTGTAWKVTNTAATVVDTDAINWAAFGGSGGGITVKDEGTPLSTTATTLDFVGAGVTATGSGATKTITIPGGGANIVDVDWFVVTDYGAVLDGTTDDTAAVQAAIDACITAGGGTVYFPPGICQISGALQNTGTHNSQLVIPTVSSAPKSIRFLGSNPTRVYAGSASAAVSTIRSDWSGTISGHPAIISAGSYRTIRESWVYVTVENLVIMAPDDPKLSALQLTACWTTRLVNVQLRTASADPSSVPTHSNACGLEGPWGLGSIVPDYAIGLDVYGFYTGIVPSEQFHGVDIGIAYCAQAMLFVGGPNSPTYTHYPVSLTKLVFTLCPRGLVFTTDVRWVTINSLAVEHDNSPWAAIYDIDDANNYAYGFIDYQVVDYGGGVGLSYELLVNGGGNLSYHWGAGKRWTLNSQVEIPTGTDPSVDPATGRTLYTASATGHLSVRTPAGSVIDLEAASGAAGGDLSGTYPNPSVVDDSHNHTAATLPSLGGQLLIADTHSTPIVFADLITNEAGDDLLYAD